MYFYNDLFNTGWTESSIMMKSSNENVFRVTGNSPVTGEFPAQRPVTRNFDVFFDLRLNGWVNNGEAGDWRRHRAHYDVTVIILIELAWARAKW